MKVLAIFGLFIFAAAFVLGESAVRHPAITPVTGESWLHHIGRTFDETGMGKTWQLGPAAEMNYAPSHLHASTVSTPTKPDSRVEIVKGSDLYRMNCRGCHGEFGQGLPPEIPSLIDPVRAASAELVGERMHNLGMELSQRQIAEFANQSRVALLKRLHEGGRDMLSFGHLNELEMRSLVAYLDQLADVPGAGKKNISVRESPVHIGELIVKSTCHLCHDAAGANPTPAEMFGGAIPPLSAIPTRVDRALLVRKVTRGAPVRMGSTGSLFRGRMPVFNYFSEDEAADVYEYLTQPPQESLGTFDRTVQATMGGTFAPFVKSETAAAPEKASSQAAASDGNSQYLFLPAVGFFMVVLISMCWITLHELRRLSTKSEASESPQREEFPAALFRVRSAAALVPDAWGPPEAAEQGRTEWGDRRKIS
jgi:cytochrome c